MALCGLLLTISGCDAGKSGPFTFTNSTGEEVNAIITQDGTVEKKFADKEKYVGQDYYTPQIVFVKGLDSEDNKKITVNKFASTTANGFDYEFVKAEGTKLVISTSLGGDYSTNEATKDDTCYLKEASGKLGEDSSQTVKLANIKSPPDQASSYTLYTSTPQFRIYNGSNQDVTSLFSLSIGEETAPTVQWNLEISYPRVEPVD